MNISVKKVNSLGLLKLPKDTKVVVAMSGGVDSSTVAGLMKKEGYNVVGITLKLYDDAKPSKESRQCCAGQDVLDAKRVSQQLNIDHKILYFQKRFKKDVIESFVDSYVAGETPIPCVLCNQTVKFRDLYSYAKELKAEAYEKLKPILEKIVMVERLAEQKNDRAQTFVRSVKQYVQQNYRITKKQMEGLNKVYKRVSEDLFNKGEKND